MRTEGTVERAFALAASGEVHSLAELRSALMREGCEEVEMHLSGRLIRDQLLQILAAAPSAAPADEPAEPAPELKATPPQAV